MNVTYIKRSQYAIMIFVLIFMSIWSTFRSIPIPKYLNILGSKAKATTRYICKEILIFDDFSPANFFYKSFQ